MCSAGSWASHRRRFAGCFNECRGWCCPRLEAASITRQTGTLLEASLLLRQPTPRLSSRPNAHIVSASLGGSQRQTTAAVVAGSVGQWDHRPRGSAAHDRVMCMLACVARVDASAAAHAHTDYCDRSIDQSLSLVGVGIWVHAYASIGRNEMDPPLCGLTSMSHN